MNLSFEKISRDVNRKNFDCGVDSLNEYLKKYAWQNFKKNVGVTILAFEEDKRDKILGYYTVSMAQVDFEHLPPEVSKGLPRYPVAAMRIGRLAVDRSAQAKGVGSALLRDALRRAVTLSIEVGTCAVLVDAINEQAKDFYEYYGFMALNDLPSALVLPVVTIAQAYELNE
jgi:GNAT superfamily N-acetyltransferase